MAHIGVTREVAEHCLAHAMLIIERTYNPYAYLDEKRDLRTLSASSTRPRPPITWCRCAPVTLRAGNFVIPGSPDIDEEGV